MTYTLRVKDGFHMQEQPDGTLKEIPKGCTFQSDDNLALLYPEKFEEVYTGQQDRRDARRKRDEAQEGSKGLKQPDQEQWSDKTTPPGLHQADSEPQKKGSH